MALKHVSGKDVDQSKIMELGKHRKIETVLEASTSEKKARLQVVLPEELHYRFKRACLDERTDMSNEIVTMIKGWLKDRGQG